jgi:carotenoid cleavage dioxygenase
MKRYPDAPEFTGLNAPLGEEYEVPDLAIEGRIPGEVEGVFFRAVPDPAFPRPQVHGWWVGAGELRRA